MGVPKVPRPTAACAGATVCRADRSRSPGL